MARRVEQALPPGDFERTVERVASRQTDAYAAVEEMLRAVFGTSPPDAGLKAAARRSGDRS